MPRAGMANTWKELVKLEPSSDISELNAPKNNIVKKPLYVTSSFLPPFEEVQERLRQVWETNQLTNNGPMVQELTARLADYLDVKHVILVSNGDAGLRIAYQGLELEGEVITTPFSYVSTTSSLIWSRLKPVFVDVEPDSLTIDANKIEDAITDRTTAIVATHVFGFPCDVKAISRIAERHDLKVIYDAAHAFGVQYHGQNILNHGHVSMVSLHATKLFHSGEGGLLATNDDRIAESIEWRRRFGHRGQEAFHGVGINAKMSELHGAVGLCVLDHIDRIVHDRKTAWQRYVELIQDSNVELELLKIPEGTEYNYAYFPVLFRSEQALLDAFTKLKTEEIYPRRYFYPSLNTVKELGSFESCPVSESAASRIACLPFSADISDENIQRVVRLLR